MVLQNYGGYGGERGGGSQRGGTALSGGLQGVSTSKSGSGSSSSPTATGSVGNALSPYLQQLGLIGSGTGRILAGTGNLQDTAALRRQAQRDPRSIIESAIMRHRERRIGLDRALSTQRAQYGAAGVGLAGTASAVAQYTNEEESLAREFEYAGALTAANRLRRQLRRAARSAEIAGGIDIGIGSAEIIAGLSLAASGGSSGAVVAA